jgi:hypothetical protein
MKTNRGGFGEDVFVDVQTAEIVFTVSNNSRFAHFFLEKKNCKFIIKSMGYYNKAVDRRSSGTHQYLVVPHKVVILTFNHY